MLCSMYMCSRLHGMGMTCLGQHVDADHAVLRRCGRVCRCVVYTNCWLLPCCACWMLSFLHFLHFIIVCVNDRITFHPHIWEEDANQACVMDQARHTYLYLGYLCNMQLGLPLPCNVSAKVNRQFLCAVLGSSVFTF